MRIIGASLTVGFFVLASTLAVAQTGQKSSQDRQAILDYPLTLPRANQLIKAMDAMTKYLVSLPDDQERLVSMRSQPLSPNAGEGLGGEGMSLC